MVGKFNQDRVTVILLNVISGGKDTLKIIQPTKLV